MKTKLFILLFAIGLAATASGQKRVIINSNIRGGGGGYIAPASGAAELPTKDPWRYFNGKGESPGSDWVRISGKVLEVQPNGIRIKEFASGGECFVRNFPYQVADDEFILYGDGYIAKSAGVYSYKTLSGGTHSVRQLDYGLLYNDVPPPPTPTPHIATPSEVAAAKAKAGKAKIDAAARVLKFHQELAAKGDAYGELKMGLRYLSGDGVARDPRLAREYLAKAAAQGNATAAEALSELTHSGNSRVNPTSSPP